MLSREHKISHYFSLPILLCIFYGCSHSAKLNLLDEERHSIDSIISLCKDTICLQEKIKTFEKEDNVWGLDKTYLRLGILLREQGLFMNAIEIHRKGMQYAKEVPDTISLVQHLNNIGTNFRRMGILDEASTYHYEAYRYCDLLSDTSYTARKNKVVSLNGIGNVQLTLGNDEEAERAFRIALNGEQSLKSDLGLAINYANLGSIFENRGQIDSARVYYQQSLLHNELAKSDLGISLCYTHFGRLYENEGKWDLAIAEYEKAKSLMEKSADSWHWLESCIALARVNISKGNLELAEKYINDAMQTSHSLHSLEHLVTVYKLQYQLAEKHGNSALSLQAYVKSQKYSDSIATEKSANHMQNVRVGYERDRRRQELSIVQREYEAEKKMRIAVLAISIALILIAVLIIIVLWYFNRTRAGKQRLMKQMEITRSQFFTNITHEFRTPLTAILGLSKDIENGVINNDEELKRSAGIIFRQGNGLLDLVNQLLDISKVKSQIGNPQWRHGNIVGYTEMIVESYRPLINQKHIEFKFSYMQTNIEMDFVPDYFRKIISNLISNALKYTPENGFIKIDMMQDDNKVFLKVSDTGCGIKADDLPHIFEPFYMGEGSTMETSTGVGLSLVSQLVNSLRGKIDVKSTVGMGSIFVVTLPIQHAEGIKQFNIDEEKIGEQKYDKNCMPADVINSDSNLPVILIVEDNDDIAYYIGSQLKKTYQLYYAHNGKEALDKAKQIIPDIIITDWMMPEMNGLTMSKEIRKNELTNHIPIIVITAKASDEDRIKGLSVGVDAYLSKPFNSDELKVRVEKLLEQRQLLKEKYSSEIREGKSIGESEKTSADRDFLNKCIDFISHSISQGNMVDIDSLAQSMCVSPRQLNRKIQALTNYAPVVLINNVKLAKAKQLLKKNPNLTMLEIANRCGYEDASYFGRVFKQMEGMTPSQYKKAL